MAEAPTPRISHGDIWLIDFDPSVGAEIRKLRPAVVASVDSIGRLPLRVVVPITDWKPDYATFPWFVLIPADTVSGLSKDSGADTFQVKSVSVNRFRRKLGTATESQMEAVSSAIALCVGAP